MKLLDNHAAYRKFREDFGINPDRKGSVLGYLLERKIKRLLAEIAPKEKLMEVALQFDLGYLVVREIMEHALFELNEAQIEEALSLYEAESNPEMAFNTLIFHLNESLNP